MKTSLLSLSLLALSFTVSGAELSTEQRTLVVSLKESLIQARPLFESLVKSSNNSAAEWSKLGMLAKKSYSKNYCSKHGQDVVAATAAFYKVVGKNRAEIGKLTGASAKAMNHNLLCAENNISFSLTNCKEVGESAKLVKMTMDCLDMAITQTDEILAADTPKPAEPTKPEEPTKPSEPNNPAEPSKPIDSDAGGLSLEVREKLADINGVLFENKAAMNNLVKRAKIYLEAYSNSGKYSAQAARNYCQEVASGRGILQKLGTMQIDVLDSVDPSIKEAKELKEVLNFIYSRFASSQNDCSHVLNNYQALSFSVAGIDHAEYLFDKILRGDRIAVEDFQRVVTGKTRIVFLKGYQDKSGGTGKNMYSPMSGRQCLLMVGSPDNNLAAGTDLVITRQNNNPPANSPSDTIRYGLFIGGEDKDIGAGILCVKGVSVDEVQLMLNRLGIELRDLE